MVIVLIIALALLGAGLLALPTFVRALPGRYAVYLPEPLLELRRLSHPDTLPTAIFTPTETGPSPTPTPSATPVPTDTPDPTETPYPTEPPQPTDTPVPSPTPTPTLPPGFSLEGVRHEHQRWNNCGPATLAMALSYYGRDETQMDIAPVLKPDPEDKNVSPGEMAWYTRELGLGATVRVNGTLERLRALVHAGYPVIVETWYVRDARDQLGHYRLVVGYDDSAQRFITYDSLDGPNVTIGYQELDELWRVFNRLYLVIYRPEQWDDLAAVLGADADDTVMYERAVERARTEAANPPDSCVAYWDCDDWVVFSHFNIGSSLTALGRHEEASAAYDQARQLGLHFRMLWYQFGPYESYYAVGRYEDVVTLANATLATATNLEESYYWRGRARLALGDTEGARSDFRTALRYHEGWGPAQRALEELNEASGG